MIQISFQSALDPFHAMFRILRLRSILIEHGPLHYDHLRILDFFLLFPFRIERIRMKQAHRSFRRIASDYNEKRPYGELPDDRTIFDRMQPMQLAGVQTLAIRQFLQPEELHLGRVKITSNEPPKALLGRIQEANRQDSALLEFLSILASQYELMGRDGLKDRSDLMDYRYDAI